MQRRTLLQSAAVIGLATLSPLALAFTEGRDYVVLDKPLPDAKNTLIKVWSYDCPFCYKFDKGVDPRVLPRVCGPDGLTFLPWHLETKGKYGRAASEYLALCRILDKKDGKPDNAPDSRYNLAKMAWYDAYHKMQERWKDGEDAFIATAAADTGVDAAAFAKHRRDPQVQALADTWRQAYDAAKVQGIPAYIVNGKYLIKTRSIRNFDGMTALIKELSALPA